MSKMGIFHQLQTSAGRAQISRRIVTCRAKFIQKEHDQHNDHNNPRQLSNHTGKSNTNTYPILGVFQPRTRPGRITRRGAAWEAGAEESLNRQLNHAISRTMAPDRFRSRRGRHNIQWAPAKVRSHNLQPRRNRQSCNNRPAIKQSREEFRKSASESNQSQPAVLDVARACSNSRGPASTRGAAWDEVGNGGNRIRQSGFATGAMSYGSIFARGARDAGHRHEQQRRATSNTGRSQRGEGTPRSASQPERPTAPAAAVPSRQWPAARFGRH